MDNKLLKFWAKYELWTSIAFLGIAIVIPLIFESPYIINIGTLSLIFVALTLSLNLVTGFMGITSLGHAAFFGAGAYTAAIITTRYGADFLIAVLCALIVTAILGLVIGAPTLRINGRYLTIVTLGFCEIMRIVEVNWVSLTNGPYGIRGIPSPTIFGIVFSSTQSKYYISLILVTLIVLFLPKVLNSRVGRSIVAIKDDEIAANSTGINTVSLKLMVFVVSSAIAGITGAVYACYLSYIDPTMFTLDKSTLILSMLILGGLGSIPGSIIGAIALTAIPEILREVPGMLLVRQIAYGIILIIMVVYKPNGLLGGFILKHIRQRESVTNTLEVNNNV